MLDNHMVLYAETPQTIHICPHCGAEWEEFADRDPIGIGTVYYEHDFALTRTYPIDHGFCRACALETSNFDDRVRYIQERGKQWSFLASLLKESIMGKLRDVDALAIWMTLIQHEPDLLDQQLREYIENECEDDFIKWRCCE